eukprot:5847635-Alexandrium_andersonii.AAC.1
MTWARYGAGAAIQAAQCPAVRDRGNPASFRVGFARAPSRARGGGEQGPRAHPSSPRAHVGR